MSNKSSVWVCKYDGKIQCDDNSQSTPLDVMKAELAALIGSDNILSAETRARNVIALCGMPAGGVNAYEITQQGWDILNSGFVGRQGFEPCAASEDSLEPMLGELISQMAKTRPTKIEELIGRPIRVYKTGDKLTKDYRSNRVNFETDENGSIVSCWFG